jgi:IclR family transcriptional regulator, acetate operon repressor
MALPPCTIGHHRARILAVRGIPKPLTSWLNQIKINLFYVEFYSMNVKVVNSLIENCFAVVECLAAEARSMRLSEIADRLGLQRSGTHRMLATLSGLGWVEQDRDTELYRLTLKLAALGHRFLAATQFLDVCQPVVDRVAAATCELVRLAVVENGELTTLAHAQGAQGSLACQSRVFPSLPLHVTASGKAWLATLSNEAALKMVLTPGFGEPKDYGPNAVRSVNALIKELKRTRERGFGLAIEEAEPGVSAVAVTICPDGRNVQGVLAVVGPAIRMSKTRIEEIARIARRGADELAMLWPLRHVRRAAIPHPRAVT